MIWNCEINIGKIDDTMLIDSFALLRVKNDYQARKRYKQYLNWLTTRMIQVVAVMC